MSTDHDLGRAVFFDGGNDLIEHCLVLGVELRRIERKVDHAFMWQ